MSLLRLICSRSRSPALFLKLHLHPKNPKSQESRKLQTFSNKPYFIYGQNAPATQNFHSTSNQ